VPEPTRRTRSLVDELRIREDDAIARDAGLARHPARRRQTASRRAAAVEDRLAERAVELAVERAAAVERVELHENWIS
jgi:hypothetical protein